MTEEFYSGDENKALGAVSNFGKNSDTDTVIITDGAVVSEALAACDKARENGINAGIILLEKIKPYGECIENIMRLMPENVKKMIFLEEEIRSGGMGMVLSDEMRRRGAINCSCEILAVNDTFVPRHEGRSMYEDAEICAGNILSALMR